MADRFIAREDDVLDLETGVRYSTADDAEAVADLLNSTPPQHVSGDVVAAELQGAIAEMAGPFGRMALALGTSHEAVRKGNVAFAKLRAAAALASPEPEAVVIDARAVECPGWRTRDGKWIDAFVFVGNEFLPLELPGGFPIGPCKVTITPIKERGE